MIVLGFDTSTPATAIGLRLPDGTTIEARDDPAPGERPGHATRLLPLAASLLAQAGLRFADIERIAVGVGPGTFTGLRIGLSSARGLAQSLDAQLLGVCSLQALALVAASGSEPAGAGLLALIDARRGEVFAAVYLPAEDPSPDQRSPIPTISPSELAPPRALAPERLQEILDEAAAHRAEIPAWLGIGNGATLYRETLHALGVSVPPEASPLHRVSGEAICALGAAGVAQDLDTVLPDYHRRPDAELALEHAAGVGARA